MSINVTLLVLVSLLRGQKPLERLQSTLFVDVFRTPVTDTSRFVNRSATRYDLNMLAQRILGPDEAYQLFQEAERRHGLMRDQSLADDAFISELERKLAGSIGAASARALISQVVIGETISLYELMKIADETQRMRDYSQRLEQKSRLLEATAGQLKDANDRLTLLDSQKDDFLSQVSHEVRTPMTSIRSLSEILLETEDIPRQQTERFLHIIHEESIRMTRLLDGILDLSLLEGEQSSWPLAPIDPEQALDKAIDVCQGLASSSSLLLLQGARARGVDRAGRRRPPEPGVHQPDLECDQVQHQRAAIRARQQPGRGRSIPGAGGRQRPRHPTRRTRKNLPEILARLGPHPLRHAGRRARPGHQLANHAAPGRQPGLDAGRRPAAPASGSSWRWWRPDSRQRRTAAGADGSPSGAPPLRSDTPACDGQADACAERRTYTATQVT